MSGSSDDNILDCDAGRSLGCSTFCCYLLVRLEPEERPAPEDGLPAKGYVDKTPDGRCIHLEPGTGRCQNWENRPRVCRAYSCNSDPLLQAVLKEGFVSLGRLVRSRVEVPPEQWQQVPCKVR
jgi:hypothetical protein